MQNELKYTPAPIEARIVIGVTGHRELAHEPLVAERLRRTLERLRGSLPRLAHTKPRFVVLSPLAEGADRLVAREVLRLPDAHLEVVLPLAKHEYLKDFSTPESVAEFEEMLSKARHVKVLSEKESRTDAYASVGRYVVENSDVLIAIWNGQPAAGRGGTAEIVQYANRRGCPVIRIGTGPDRVVEEKLAPELPKKKLEGVDKYEGEAIEHARLDAEIDKKAAELIATGQENGLPKEMLEPILQAALPHYVRADLLALDYQRRHTRAGTWVYGLAAAGVAIAALQGLFFPEQRLLVLAEMLLMALVLYIIYRGRGKMWHTKWLDYRFLAERFRAAIFMALVNLELGIPLPPRHLSLAYSPKDWIVTAFASVWNSMPRNTGITEAHVEPLKSFLLAAWVNSQIEYHKSKAKVNARNHHGVGLTGDVLFGLTFVAALLHFSGVGPPVVHTVLSFVAAVAPAVGGALAGIGSHREYQRNAERSEEMERHLTELGDRIAAVTTVSSLLELVAETEETMRYELADWRVLSRVHKVTLPS